MFFKRNALNSCYTKSLVSVVVSYSACIGPSLPNRLSQMFSTTLEQRSAARNIVYSLYKHTYYRHINDYKFFVENGFNKFELCL